MDPGGQPERMIWFLPADSSSADAEVLRYQTLMYSMYMAERTFIRQVGWYRRSCSCPKDGIRAFFNVIGKK